MTGDVLPPARRGLLAPAALLALAAVALPQSWLTGTLGAEDPAGLRTGAWLLRGALLAVAGLLALAPRLERTPSRGAPAGGASDALPWTRRETLALVALTALALALRLVRVGTPLWFDEIWMLRDSVRPPLAETLRTFASDNNHPLYSALATLSVRAFGTEAPWALRLPAVLFGAACVPAVHVLGRVRFGRATAFAAAAATACAFHHVFFAQNARGYSGLLLFTLLSSHHLLRALHGARRRDWLLHGVYLALCVALHLTGVFTAVGHVAVIAWSAWRRPAGTAPGGVRAALLGLGLATLLGFAAYALVFPQVVHFFLLRPDRVAVEAEWTNPLWAVDAAAESLGLGVALGRAVVAAGALGLLASLRPAWRRDPGIVLLLVVPAVAVAAAMLGLGRNLWPRLFYFLAGFGTLVALEAAVTAARVAARLLRAPTPLASRAPWVACVLVVCAAASTLPRAYALPKQDYAAAEAWVAAHRAPGEPVAAAGEMTVVVFRDWIVTDWAELRTLEDFQRLFPPGRTGFVVYAFPVFVRSRLPDVWSELERRGREVHVVPAAIGGGEVHIVRIGD